MLHSRVLRYIDEVARLGSIRAAGDRLRRPGIAADDRRQPCRRLHAVTGRFEYGHETLQEPISAPPGNAGAPSEASMLDAAM